MEHSIVFNHDATDVASSIGTSIDDVSTAVSNLIRRYMTEDGLTKRSHLCEIIANECSTEIIVFLACSQVMNSMDEFEEDLKKFAMFKSLIHED